MQTDRMTTKWPAGHHNISSGQGARTAAAIPLDNSTGLAARLIRRQVAFHCLAPVQENEHHDAQQHQASLGTRQRRIASRRCLLVYLGVLERRPATGWGSAAVPFAAEARRLSHRSPWRDQCQTPACGDPSCGNTGLRHCQHVHLDADAPLGRALSEWPAKRPTYCRVLSPWASWLVPGINLEYKPMYPPTACNMYQFVGAGLLPGLSVDQEHT
jgi:hypothetical protein